MSLAAPKPLSASTSPSLGPAAARAAAQEAQISHLVEQNRALEHSATQLHAQLRAEEARGIHAVNQIRERWKAESKEWKDGCDSLQARHRLAHLETRLALEHERGLRLEDREALTREKIAVLLREHKITLFQAKETDLMAQLAVLEDEIEMQREQLAEILFQHEAELARLTAELAHSEAQQSEKVRENDNVVQLRNTLEVELATLRSSSTSHVKQIERLNLQLETLRTQNSTIETRNRELQHQVDKWQSLEGKGEKEVEALRKRRIELEVRVKELEVNLKESRGVDKKIAKLETSLLETQEQVEQGEQEIAEAQAEAMEARKQSVKLERHVEKLQAALEAEKTRSAEALKKEREKIQSLSKPPSKVRSRAQSVIEAEEVEENEVEELPAKSQLRNKKTGSVRSKRTNAAAKGKGKEGADSEDVPDRSKAKGKGKERAKQTDIVEIEDGELVDDDEVVEVPPPTKKRGRPQEQETDVEEVPPLGKKAESSSSQQVEEIPEATKKPHSRTGKAKEIDDEEEHERPKKRSRSKPASTNGQGARKSSSERAEVEEEQPVKKKKRKLNQTSGTNIFGGPAGFTWNQDGAGDLGIPSVLSPVKEGEPVPARSASNSSLLSAWHLKIPW